MADKGDKRDVDKEIDFSAIPVFSGLDRIGLAKLIPTLQQIRLDAGEVLYKAGDDGDAFYVVVDGIIRVFVAPGGESSEIACLGPGDGFGEMALLTGEPRTNDIEAQTDALLLRLSREHFNQLIRQYPSIGVSVAGLLASKLVSTNVFLQKGASGAESRATTAPATSPGAAAEPSISSSSNGPPRVSEANRRQRHRRIAALILIVLLCGGSSLFLTRTSLTAPQIIIVELLLGATIVWSSQTLSFHAVSLALPVATVLLGAASPKVAFSGFPSATWFLVLAVFGLSAAIAKTGLLYRVTLVLMKRFPQTYLGQTFAIAFSGVLLTPIVPSPNGRLVLSSPLVLTLTEILGFKKGRPGAVGLSMANFLGHGSMSVLFMNGSFVCFFMLALLPPEIGTQVTWFYWLKVTVVLSLSYFFLLYCVIVSLYRPEESRPLNVSITDVQLNVLGPVSTDEKVCIFAVTLTLAGFLTQSWHHIDGAWIALTSIVILLATSVLDDKTMRSNIDWVFLVSLGALIGFGNVVAGSGLTQIAARAGMPYLELLSGSKLLFLLIVAVGVVLIRFVLPAFPALVVCMLALLPIAASLDINPFVIGLVVLLLSEPWFFPHQSLIFQTLMSSSEGRLFDHRQALKLAFYHVAVAVIAIVIAFPYWKYLGLIR
jgi:di/tricarboxylate transporter/CRP-like cAMP-binding protein